MGSQIAKPALRAIQGGKAIGTEVAESGIGAPLPAHDDNRDSRRVPSASSSSSSFSPPSDDELIEALLRGDDRIASLLYDRVIGTVDRTLCRIFGRREADHDDLVQSTFEQIVITLTRQRFARACSLRTWASSVATHVGLNALRSRRRERRVVDHARDASDLDDAADVPTSRRGTDASMQARLMLDRIRRHLTAMDPKKAEALFLHDALGHDLAEISVITGVSVAAAQSRLVRARKELMRRLEADGGDHQHGAVASR